MITNSVNHKGFKIHISIIRCHSHHSCLLFYSEHPKKGVIARNAVTKQSQGLLRFARNDSLWHVYLFRAFTIVQVEQDSELYGDGWARHRLSVFEASAAPSCFWEASPSLLS
jgi:hypothetical protein